MLQRIKTEAPAYVHHDQELTVEYAFSEYTQAGQWMTNSKVWLEILFVHPQKSEVVTIRIAKTTLLLCQSKEMIEATVHREIRNFLHQTQVKEFGTAYSHLHAVPAF